MKQNNNMSKIAEKEINKNNNNNNSRTVQNNQLMIPFKLPDPFQAKPSDELLQLEKAIKERNLPNHINIPVLKELKR